MDASVLLWISLAELTKNSLVGLVSQRNNYFIVFWAAQKIMLNQSSRCKNQLILVQSAKKSHYFNLVSIKICLFGLVSVNIYLFQSSQRKREGKREGGITCIVVRGEGGSDPATKLQRLVGIKIATYVSGVRFCEQGLIIFDDNCLFKRLKCA